MLLLLVLLFGSVEHWRNCGRCTRFVFTVDHLYWLSICPGRIIVSRCSRLDLVWLKVKRRLVPCLARTVELELEASIFSLNVVGTIRDHYRFHQALWKINDLLVDLLSCFGFGLSARNEGVEEGDPAWGSTFWQLKAMSIFVLFFHPPNIFPCFTRNLYNFKYKQNSNIFNNTGFWGFGVWCVVNDKSRIKSLSYNP